MFGAGYVGLVTGACFADLGHEVVIRDVVPERIERLRAGEVPIYEPGLEQVLARNAEGSAIADFMRPDRIVIGAFNEADADRVVDLHQGIETEIVRTDVPSAELVKLAANAFLSTRISFINEIANVCELVGADVVDVAK